MVVTLDMLKFIQELRKPLRSYLREEKFKEFINFTLHYIADLDIPIKRFVKCRNIYRVSKILNMRPKMVYVLRETFAHLVLTFSIGGQRSFDG
ncbi:unnamed protein product [Camellia sinensis]